MTPGQARVALLTFLLVTTGGVVNALFLQNRATVDTKATTERPPARPPAADRARKPGEVTRTDRPKPSSAGAATEQPLRIAHFAPDTAKLDAMLPAAQSEVATETVRAIQRELKARGYGPLASDGVMGLTTRAGIMAFEYDHGLALTGEANEDLLRRILLGTSTDTELVGAGKVQSIRAEQMIRTVQQRLSGLG